MPARRRPAITARWSTQQDHGEFAVQSARLAGCNLSVMWIGTTWSWLVRRGERDIAEGLAASDDEARAHAEAACLRRRATKSRRGL
jgi:hypothetical protein